jgi:predicted GIY-YIG superfamily endonuclease
MISQFQINHLLNTIEAIARSPQVRQYVIGYTSKAPHIRFGQYRGRGYHHLVVLATQMVREDALDLEAHLQERVKSEKDHVLYQKYREKKRDRPHARSAGGSKLDPNGLGHSVYMAWIESPTADGNEGSTTISVSQ